MVCVCITGIVCYELILQELLVQVFVLPLCLDFGVVVCAVKLVFCGVCLVCFGCCF